MPDVTYSQTDRRMGVETPLETDALLLVSMQGREELGRLYQYEVELASLDAEIDLDKLLGQPMAVWAENASGERRHFHGVISSFHFVGIEEQFARYRATLVPWLWLLTRNADSRIFQNMTAPEIILQVFRDRGFSDFADELSAEYPKREYCVQHNETDFNFVMRLMEEEGIYYYFRHESSVHTLVLCDAPAAHTPQPGYEELLWRPPASTRAGDESIAQWQIRKQVRPGTFAHADYNFETPRQRLLSTLTMKPNPDHAHSDHERFEYPGRFHDPDGGNRIARLRMEEAQCRHEIATGTTDARGIATGFTFELAEYPRQSLNRKYLVIAARYSLSTNSYRGGEEHESRYTCSFDAIGSDIPFRLERITPRPVIAGPQTAEVVGPAGEEIHVDKYGRIKVQFHWDRDGEHDENSSCFIRVAEGWAGRNWGAVFTPRIGQEVVVEFIDGDPDRPLVTGSVYNAVQMPPYELPSHKTRSSIKTLTTPDGEGFNEIRFEDKKDQEQIFIHGQRNFDLRVRNDYLRRVFGNCHSIIGWDKDGKQGGDHLELVHQDKHLSVKRHQVEHIEGNYMLTVGKGDADGGSMDLLIEKDKKETIEANSHINVKADRNEQVGGAQSLTVGGDQQEKVGGNHALDAGQEIHLKAGMKVILEAGMQLTIKAAGSFVDIGPAGVTIQGAMVKINSGGAAGSGSGASPTKPQDAEQAAPTEPALADDDEPGQVSN